MNKEEKIVEVNTPNNITWYGTLVEEFLRSYSIYSSHTHKLIVVPKDWVQIL